MRGGAQKTEKLGKAFADSEYLDDVWAGTTTDDIRVRFVAASDGPSHTFAHASFPPGITSNHTSPGDQAHDVAMRVAVNDQR